MHIEKFEHNGIKYLIRVANNSETVCVQILQEDRTEYQKSYFVTLETMQDMQTVMESDVINTLIETAKQDIISENF